MKLLSWRRDEIIIIWPGICYFLQKLVGAPRTPRGLTLWPFIILREEDFPAWLINHERIHLAQMRETLILGLDILIILESLYSRLILRQTAEENYYWHAGEQEAYLNQHNLDYLKTRKPFSIITYMRHKKRFRVTDVPGEIEFY